MPIYRCNQCGLITEDLNAPVGSKVPCARCAATTTVFDTVYYVEKLIERYTAAGRELNALKQATLQKAPQPIQPVSAATPSQPTESAPGNTRSSKQLATAEQHAPVRGWFAKRSIEANLDYSLVDTSGFFDDAAVQIGQGYRLFSELIDRVRYAYRNNQTWINLQLANLSQKDQQAITQLCRNLYKHTFFARYGYQKQEKVVNLTLQTALSIRQFFEGGWLEWYAFITLVAQLDERQRGFSCARSVKIVFPNEDLHELDVFVLPQNQPPICIECKSGEFRRDIDKYLRMRKRLGLERSRFIICAADLTDDECNGLSAMYELTFVNLESLGAHLQTLF